MINKPNPAEQAFDDANNEKKKTGGTPHYRDEKATPVYNCFVMMTFDEIIDKETNKSIDLFRKFEDAAKRLLDININVNLVRADQKFRDFKLIESVHKHIRESDFCLADITGRNPNVMYEVGFARALDKELIVVSQDQKPYPIDVANHIVVQYTTKSHEDLVTLTEKLAGYFKEAVKIVELKKKSAKESYEITCFESGEVSDLSDAFKKAEKVINILESNLERVFKYAEDIKIAMEAHNELEFRVLALDPDSYFAQARARQLGVAIAHYRHKLHENIEKIIDEFKGYRGQFSLQVYDDFPTQISFAVDNKIYSCTVARNARARDLCTFKLSKYDAGVERSFGFHFDALWSNSHAYQAHTL